MEGASAMGWYGHGMDGWGFAFMALSMLLIWAAIIVGIVFVVRLLGRGGSPERPAAPVAPVAPHQEPGPQEILARRFAQGEIDEEEYQRRLRVLGGTPTR
ncbi:MAG TPA: SHOCT domain-containing protein [Micromonosporaceae bacterium]